MKSKKGSYTRADASRDFVKLGGSRCAGAYAGHMTIPCQEGDRMQRRWEARQVAKRKRKGLL